MVALDQRGHGESQWARPPAYATQDFAVKLTNEPADVRREDTERLRALGFSEEDTWDIIEIAAMFNFTNRLMSGAGVIPNPEYHALAR